MAVEAHMLISNYNLQMALFPLSSLSTINFSHIYEEMSLICILLSGSSQTRTLAFLSTVGKL